MSRYRAGEHLPYFCTITILDWVPVFIDARTIDPLVDSLRFSREKKGVQLFAFVVMPNHLHLIAAADDLHAVMRDFKRFTSRTIHERLVADGRETILTWLQRAAQAARRERGEFSFWQDGFHPQAITSRAMFEQKLAYLHGNPVRKGLVATPEDWWYGSAAWYAGRKPACMEMDLLEF
ncbi:Transposase IS200 like protein [Phycisphaerae bacterium RAS1]|nr:Transposase IS200 like protein [Phycisphaerae bacterium RAS1]